MPEKNNIKYSYTAPNGDKIFDLFESGVKAFVINTNYNSDLDRIIRYMVDRAYFDSSRIIEAALCSNYFEGNYIYADDLFYYEFLNNKNNADPSAKLSTALYSEPILNEMRNKRTDRYLPHALEIADKLAGMGKIDIIGIRDIQRFFIGTQDKYFIQSLVRICRSENPCMILLTTTHVDLLPKEIEPYIHIIQPFYPDRKAIEMCLLESIHGVRLNQYFKNEIISALQGFHLEEIKRLLYYSISKYGREASFDVRHKKIMQVVGEEKKQLLLKSDLLEWLEVGECSIEGLGNARLWLENTKVIFENLEEAMDNGVNIPKGLLISGVPGTGKSLFAKFSSLTLNMPLIKLDMGRLMGSLVGESEANLRKATSLAESLSPCVLWIDEIEKGFGNSDSDGAYLKRMTGSFLTWMQEKSCACFVMATANDVSKLPSEFLRKGRFDEKYYTLMPTKQECIQIFSVHLSKAGRSHIGVTSYKEGESLHYSLKPDLENTLERLLELAAKSSKFLTGADIEALVSDTFKRLFISYKKQSPMNNYYSKHDFDRNNFEKELIASLDSTKTYGETNLKQIAECFIKLNESRFMPASSIELIEFKTPLSKPLKPQDKTDYNQQLKFMVLNMAFDMNSS